MSALSVPSRTARFIKSSQAPTRQRRRHAAVQCSGGGQAEPCGETAPRRQLLLAAAALAAAGSAEPAQALGFKKDLTNKRKQRVPESEYKDGPQGLKYYDVTVGNGAEAVEGARVVVHFEVKWRGVTFITTRQGMGVTGGSPLGFDIGAKPGAGGTLKGLDLGVRGMRVGGRRKLILPPELAYGKKGVGEIPPDATLDADVELLSIKQDAIGYRVKLVEG